jgi:hypothetical protein
MWMAFVSSNSKFDTTLHWVGGSLPLSRDGIAGGLADPRGNSSADAGGIATV